MKKILISAITITSVIFGNASAQTLDCGSQKACTISAGCRDPKETCIPGGAEPIAGSTTGICIKIDPDGWCVPMSANEPDNNKCPGVPSPCQDPVTNRSLRDANGDIVPPICINGRWACQPENGQGTAGVPDCGICCSPNAGQAAMPGYRIPAMPITQRQAAPAGIDPSRHMTAPAPVPTPQTWTMPEYMRRPTPQNISPGLRANALGTVWEWLFGK